MARTLQGSESIRSTMDSMKTLVTAELELVDGRIDLTSGPRVAGKEAFVAVCHIDSATADRFGGNDDTAHKLLFLVRRLEQSHSK